ncbi:MAG: class I mannose-6-phosphate isomerase [Phycisphaerales bacterium]|nr:class I mannose-6-phosphate isomerase [Phycisphaerales bacterium]
MDVHPLIFQPIFKPRLWGGRALEQVLGKPLPPHPGIGESWELADLHEDVSVVARGPAQGRTLRQLVAEWGVALMGRAPLAQGRFPLLLKYLDARDTLSVQVHPTPEAALASGGAVSFKHEAWYVVGATGGACIYRGLLPGADRAHLGRAVEAGEVESVLQRIPVKPGQAFYLPAGTVHALGAGVLVAEVQTPGDVTYRLHDWNRVDPLTGRPRDLHVAEALRCVQLDLDVAAAEARSHVASVWTAVTRLITCESFRVERVRMVDGVEQDIPYDEMVTWMVLSGRGEASCRWGADRVTIPFSRGDTLLLPAGMKEARVRTDDDCSWLEITVPIRSDLAEYARPDRESLRAAGAGDATLVSLNVPPRGQGKAD